MKQRCGFCVKETEFGFRWDGSGLITCVRCDNRGIELTLKEENKSGVFFNDI